MKFVFRRQVRLPDARPWPGFRIVGPSSFAIERIGDLATIAIFPNREFFRGGFPRKEKLISITNFFRFVNQSVN
jgi:hypothetical protein